ncbi:autophagy 2 [Wolffia australiana]
MFRWDFAKSAEAMLSRWAIKRICRFLLKKKKLGDYIDLEQLDVQLADGVIQLRDLALNVDFINEKLGDAPVFVREGTILSLSFKIPWKMKNCQIEVEDLELVIAPSRGTRVSTNKDGDDENESQFDASDKQDRFASSGCVSNVSLGVHEGVKTIAKIVKWFLTSFNIVIRNLIVAFDPCLESGDSSSLQNLVLRIAEIEYGTRISEDTESQPSNLLGIGKLTNFIKFGGATVEFLKMVKVQTSETSISDILFKCSSPLVCSPDGGISGNLNLSIPWKNGSLDLNKIGAVISFNPVKLCLKQSSVMWLSVAWESLKKIEKYEKRTETVHSFHASKMSSSRGFLSCRDFQMNQRHDTIDSPAPTYIIQNWVTSDNLEVPAGLEDDYGASIDQFFECFDELRSSQASLGNSGIWNWTCSVFSAITLASSLASESVYYPCEQQQSETNVKANVSAIYIMFSFDDKLNDRTEDLDGRIAHQSLSDGHDPSSHLLEMICQDVHLNLQIFQEFTEVDATIRSIHIDDILVLSNEADRFLSMISGIQAGVEVTLPAGPSINHEMTDNSIQLPSEIKSGDVGNRLVSVPLLQSTGTFCFKCSLSSASHSSFSINLPPLTLWIDFSLLNTLLSDIKRVEKSLKYKETMNPPPDDHGQEHDTRKKRINVFLSRTRIVLCFPPENLERIRRPFHWSSFIVLDFSALSKGLDTCLVQKDAHLTAQPYSSSTLLDLRCGFLDTFLLTSSYSDEISLESVPSYVCKKILSISGGTDNQNPGITILWQEGPVTGPWLAQRAWALAGSLGPSNKKNVSGSGNEFSSTTRSEDRREASSQVRQEMVLSSSIFTHIHLSRVSVDLSCHEYRLLHRLLKESLMKEESVKTDGDASQTSLLLECDTVEVTIGVADDLEISNSLQRELIGSWNSLKLEIQEFELLSVSNVGGINRNSFLWLSHGEGDLWGSITNVGDFLLITCKNSAMKRGDGGGGNSLFSGSSGTSFIHVENQEILQSLTSIDIRCATFIAPGGRLDWFNSISVFFVVSSDEENEVLEDSGTRTHFFFLNLVDVALCYEPYTDDLSAEKKLSCLLAAASLSIYDQPSEKASGCDYVICLQDLGLLLSEESDPGSKTDGYSTNYLNEINYVKVAKEALLNAVLRTNCPNDLQWELEICDSHIYVSSCFDSTSGLARLAGQLQQLFAPDVEEALTHLQSRWHSLKQSNDIIGGDSDIKPTRGVNEEKDESCSTTGIMDGILDDAFSSSKQRPNFNLDTNDSLTKDFSLNMSMAELIEGYYPRESTLRSSSPGSSSPDEPSTPQVNFSVKKEVDLGKGRWFKDAPWMIVEDHISDVINEKNHQFSDSTSTCKPRGRVSMKNVNMVWRMYRGSDWPKNSRVSDEIGRDENICLELTLSGISLQYDTFREGGLFLSKVALCVKDFHLYDMSKNAPWKMVLGYYNSRDHPRESSSKAIKLDLESVKPDPSTPLEEYRLHFSFLPLRVHLHQGQLEFLVKFFANDSSSGRNLSTNTNLPVCPESISADMSYQAQDFPEEALLPFFQKFDIHPAVIRVDYIPHHVDMAALRAGNYVQLINLVPWKGIEIQLKPVHAVGVYGWGSICDTVIGAWLEDISQNQIHKVLKGLTPVKSLFAVSSGATKLVSVPVKSYRKDHRLLKGLQRGAIAFIRSISLEAIGLGVHVAGGAHELLLHTEQILSGSQPLMHSSRYSGIRNVRRNQPNNSHQGILQAYESLSDGLGKTTAALVGTPLKTYQRGAGTGSALASAIRAAPVAAVAPASAVARAVHCTLLGVRNSLDPEHKKESMEKYLGSSQSQEQ